MKKRKETTCLKSKDVGESLGHVVDALSKKCSSVLETEIEEIHGYRFTKEEDAIIRNAIFKYIKEKQWEEEKGLEKLLNYRKYTEDHGCWDEIKRCLPHRPPLSVRRRAHTLFEKGSFLGRWSKQEAELLRSLQDRHGNRWKLFSTIIGRSESSIKEKWRCIKKVKTTGVWTREEMEQLSDLVHQCLRLNQLEGRKRRRVLLRDNICWDWIADIIGTHNHGVCCNKWYRNLSAGMVRDGQWFSIDDFLLLESLLQSGACSEEEVEWNSLLDHRSGQTCLLRWKQLAKHLGENQTRGFLEKLDSLASRYAPELLFPYANHKMYGSLSAVMVTDGQWSSIDDFLLLESLLESGACSEEEVEWDRLLDHRSGQTCLLRWKQLAKHLGENQTRGFLEKLDSLVNRYFPELLF